MRVEDLLPYCNIQDCPERGKHKHLLPHQQEFLDSDAKYVFMRGGYGSAKTLIACALGVLLSVSIPGNFGVIGRRTYSKLHDSTLQTFQECVERAEREWGIEVERKENRDGFCHRFIFPQFGSQVIVRETKDPGRWLGPQLGWFLIDEALEEPESTFTKLMGRLRLPAAGKYLKGILLSNPPNRNHWLVRWFGESPGVREIEDQESGVKIKFHLIVSATTQNPHLPKGYVSSLKLLNPAEYRRVVTGELGFTADGDPVYPAFKHEVHVGVPDLVAAPVKRGWDFGFRHPVCIWGQTWRCEQRSLHLTVLHEMDAQHVEAEEFGKRVLLESRTVFRPVEPHMYQDAGDAAGAAVSDKGPGAIIRLARAPFNLRFRYTKIKDIDPGLQYINKLFRAGLCACRRPIVQIHRNCRNLIDAVAGGYHYPAGKPKDRPVKDGFYDDFADAFRYLVWNFHRPEMADQVIAEMAKTTVRATPGKPWSWMDPEPTPEQVAAEIQKVKELARRR